jgi:predicted 3-demethylubiquinone-9 3-methyltransferase (glyoxalase superfamily)
MLKQINTSKPNSLSAQIVPCLWFDNQAGEAAMFYTSIFPNSIIGKMSYFGKEGKEYHKQEEGQVMTVNFTINGQPFMALNGGPLFKFNEAISFQVFCETQDEIDYYWNTLTEGGEEVQCGWLKDKFGISWQIIPTALPELMSNPKNAGKITLAYMQMKKFDIAKLYQAIENL